MSDEKINVSATAKTVSNDKTKKKEEELEASKKAQTEALKKAEEARSKAKEEASKKTETKKEESSSNNTEAILAGAAAIGASALSGKKTKGFFSGLIVGIIIGGLLVGVLGFSNKLFGTVDTTKQTADEVIDETFTGYTAVDFKDAILGEASQHQEIIVMEQPLEIATTITKAGLGNLSIFSKVKNINYAGTGVYTVDMKSFSEDNVSVDEENKKVTVKIPHSTLQYTNIDYDSVEFEDTEKGLLAFGDLALTTEQQNTLEQSIIQAMKEKLETQDLLDKADDFAKMSVWNMFQPLVTAISPEYVLEVVFD